MKGRIWDQNMCRETKHLRITLVINNMQIFFNLNEVLSKIQIYIFFVKIKKFKKKLI
jgi:hypothetical protein